MNRMSGAALLAVAVVLLLFGLDASGSLGSPLSRLFQGWPADRIEWFYIGSAGLAVLGLDLLLASKFRTA